MSSPMGLRAANAPAAMPTLPTGFAIAAYPTYAQASAAVEYLGKHDFALRDLSIVGSDLLTVERVTGRLTAGKMGAAGAASGAWLGLFVGLVMTLFRETPALFGVILFTVAVGAVFGAILGFVGHFMTKGKRDFTSASQVVARRYDVLCEPRTAEQARTLLARMQLGPAAT